MSSERPASTVNSPPVAVASGAEARVAPVLPTEPALPATQLLGLPVAVAQAGVQPSLSAPIRDPSGPVKSLTLPVSDQPVEPPRKSVTVTVLSAPLDVPPVPKSTGVMVTVSPACVIDSVPGTTDAV